MHASIDEYGIYIYVPLVRHIAIFRRLEQFEHCPISDQSDCQPYASPPETTKPISMGDNQFQHALNQAKTTTITVNTRAYRGCIMHRPKRPPIDFQVPPEHLPVQQRLIGR
jgi:hypothetical protein